MCQRNNHYNPKHARAQYAYKTVLPQVKRTAPTYDPIPGKYLSYYKNMKWEKGTAYDAKGRTNNKWFVTRDVIDGGAFHVYPTLAGARDAQRWGAVVVKVAVSDYIATGHNGDTETACYRKCMIIGEVK